LALVYPLHHQGIQAQGYRSLPPWYPEVNGANLNFSASARRFD
jgi:hypothetical protein